MADGAGIWENLSYDAACEHLCRSLGIPRSRVDDITSGVMGRLAENPLQFSPVGASNAYAIPIRGFDVHPDLIVIFTYDISVNATFLEWIGEA